MDYWIKQGLMYTEKPYIAGNIFGRVFQDILPIEQR